MVKTKNNVIHAPLVIIGYILFSLLVVSTLLSTTIPFGMMLFNPHVLHANVAVIAIALTLGSVLPALLGYIIGDHSIKSKSTLSHHFNGILFAMLAFWFMTIVSVFVTVPDGLFADIQTRILIINLIPSIGVAIMTALLAVAHVRSRQAKKDILEFKPFSIALFALIIAMPLWSFINNIAISSVSIYTFVSPAVMAVIGLISYASLRRTLFTKYSKAVWSAVSISVAFVAYYAVSIFVDTVASYLLPRSTMEEQAATSIIGLVLALLVWAVYWRIQAKSLYSA